MTDEELSKLLEKLEVVTDEVGEQQVIELENLDLCAPDNIRNMDMPYPDRADTIEKISDIVNGDDIKGLLTHDLLGDKDIMNKIQSLIDSKIIDPSLNMPDMDRDPDDDKKNILDLFAVFDKDKAIQPIYDFPIENYAIIEFGDEYTLGEAVEYTLSVEPGQQLTTDTIIGTIRQGGKIKPIRSIFKTGRILMNEDGDDFFHLYPDSCNRHIVVKDFEFGFACDYKEETIQGFTDRFMENTMLYNLIKDNIVYSTLPKILQNRESRLEHFVEFHICFYKHSHNVYDDFIEDFEDDFENQAKAIEKASSADKLKATRGNDAKVQKCADEANAAREAFLNWVISWYNKASSQPKVKYIDNQDDCRYLAQGSASRGGTGIVKDEFDVVKVGNTKTSNYYGQLLGRICMIYGDKWSVKYFNLISQIIKNRMSIEQYSITYMISEFNQLYRQNINGGNSNAYNYIANQFLNKPDLEYGDVYNFIYEQLTNKSDYHLINAVQHLANIYWFIKNFDGINTGSMEGSTTNTDILELVKEEWNKISGFWTEAIAAYRKIPINNIINDLKEYAESLNDYAVWPCPMDIPVQGITYKLYTFANPFIEPKEKEPMPDEDIDFDAIIEPKEPTEFPIPTEPSDGSNDPTVDEITVKDYDYWKKYFSLATVVSIPFLADGFDVPPTMFPIPLPGIYICFSTVFIQPLNIVIVIGLAIRGIWLWPVVLFVNCSSTPASYLTPLIMAIQKLRELFMAKLEKIECTIPNLVQIIINKLEKENIEYRKLNVEYQLYIDILKSQRLENKELMRKSIKDQFNPRGDTRQVITRLEKLTQLP